MQTERVTFLATPDQKAALEAFAAERGKSVGHVVREATTRYIAEGATSEDEDAALDLALDELEQAIPAWQAKLNAIENAIDAASKAIRDSVAAVEATN